MRSEPVLRVRADVATALAVASCLVVACASVQIPAGLVYAEVDENASNAGKFTLVAASTAPASVPTTSVPPIDINRDHASRTSELRLHGGVPIVHVRGLDGPMRLILDTGSDQFIVAEEFVERRGLALMPIDERIRDISGRELRIDNATRLPWIEIGAESFVDVDVRVVRFSDLALPLDARVDGLIGLGLFDDHLVEIDLKVGTLSVRRHDGSTMHDGYAYQNHRGRVLVDLEVGAKVLPALIDTGDNGHIGMHDAFVAHVQAVGSSRELLLRGFASSTRAREVTINDRLYIGPWQLPPGPIRFSSYPEPDLIAARIGTATLTQFHITIDRRNHLIRFAPN